MDIDEFLDREASELGLGAGKSADAETAPEELQASAEPSSLFESVRISLSKGALDDAEQAYVQLWRILMDQRLKWSKEMHDQMLILSRQFLDGLNKAYNDVKRKTDYIYNLIKKARAAIKEGKKGMPYKIYSEIQEINNSIPNVFFEEKKMIQEQINIFYGELRNTTDNELIKRVHMLIREISQLIDKTNLSIRSNDFISSVASYKGCIELFSNVPEGFLKEKTQLGIRILGIYKILSINNEISTLQRQIVQQPPPMQQMAMPKMPASLIANAASKSRLLDARKERAKWNLKRGLYNEASKEIEEALQIEPKDPEAKVIHAKIKTLK